MENTDFLDRACVYVILCKKINGRYEVVYTGETGEVGTRLANHERSSCWKSNCFSDLYVAVCWTPSTQFTPEDRRKIEKEIRDQYNPLCNRQ